MSFFFLKTIVSKLFFVICCLLTARMKPLPWTQCTRLASDRTISLPAQEPLSRTRLSSLDRHWSHSPLRGQPGALCSHYKSMNCRNDFESIHFKLGKKLPVKVTNTTELSEPAGLGEVELRQEVSCLSLLTPLLLFICWEQKVSLSESSQRNESPRTLSWYQHFDKNKAGGISQTGGIQGHVIVRFT